MKEDGEYKEGGEEEEAPAQNKRSQRCGLSAIMQIAREILSILRYGEKNKNAKN